MEKRQQNETNEPNYGDQVRSKLESLVISKPDGKPGTYGEQIDYYKSQLPQFYPDYKNPEKVILIPQQDAQEIAIANKLEGGKGFINESFLRYLLDSQLSSRCKYLAVHGHKFHSKLVPGNDRLFFNALREGQVQVKETFKCFESEHDFILLHPKRGIIFIEIQGTDSLNGNMWIQVVQQKREQCRKACLCLKAYVKWALQQSDPENFHHVDIQLDQLFKSFASFVFFPSLNKSQLNSTAALAIDIDTLFMEDRQNPSKLMRTIESRFVNIQDQDLYQQVYDIALTCCIASRHEIISNGLRLNGNIRSETREEHLTEMENSFRHWVGSIFFDQNQLEAYETSNRVVFIDGRAGSGKTLVCFEKMVLLSQEFPQDQILYLCSSVKLANYVGELMTERKSTTPLRNICVMDVESFIKIAYYSVKLYPYGRFSNVPPATEMARMLCKFNSVEVNLQKNNQYNVGVPEKQLNLSFDDVGRRKFRHVFIDEYQDFADEYRMLMTKWFLDHLLISDRDGSFWAFYDDKQKVHRDRSPVEVPDEAKRISLTTMHRCTQNIAQHFAGYIQGEKLKMGHQYEGPPIKIYFPDQPGQVSSCLDRVIQDVQTDHNIGRQDIVIIRTCHRNKRSQSRWRETVDSDIFQNWKAKGFDCQEVCSFKGLERRVVIFFYPPMYDDETANGERSEIMYLAASRATWLYIVIVPYKGMAEKLHQETARSELILVSPERSAQIIADSRERKRQKMEKY